MQSEVLTWQDNMLKQHFVDGFLATLQKAIEMKRKR